MMNFEKFVNYIKENVTMGWKEDASTKIFVVQKNNGVKLYALCINEPDTNISPSIYLEEYYNSYQDGLSMESVVENIRKKYVEKKPADGNLSIPADDFSFVQDKIFYRVVNYDANKEILSECPHIKLNDLAVTFRWIVIKNEQSIGSSLITNDAVRQWGISDEDLYLIASENTPRLFPAKIYDMDKIFGGFFWEEDSHVPMYILTNEQGMNGASCLLYTDILKDFSKKHGGDIYILPLSIHEVILIPADKISDLTKLYEAVSGANSNFVAETDILSNSIYFYDRSKDQIQTLSEENFGK